MDKTRYRHLRPIKAGKIYNIKKDWIYKTGHKILIIRVYRQRLGDITPEEVVKEGGYTLAEFKDIWERINDRWNPDDVVIVYKFKVVKQPESERLNGFLRGLF